MSVKDMPCVTVEQVLALRKAAIELEQEVERLNSEQNKAKADAVRDAIESADDWYNNRTTVSVDHVYDYADKLERGEVC